MKHILFAAIILCASSPALADAVIEYGCVVLAKGPSGKVERILPDTKVLQPTQSLPKFSIMLPQGYSDASVQCLRSDLVPSENDWKVLRAGYALIISEKPTGKNITLELRNGRFNLVWPEGSTPPEDQLNRLQARINQLQTSMQDYDFPPAAQK